MSRIIKFRAWDKKEKVMHSVDELMNLWSQYSDEDEKKNPGIKKIPHVTTVHQAYRGDDLKLVVGQDCDLMQFTGLLDKNGKEIYEGDILWRDKFSNWIVKWQDGSFRICNDVRSYDLYALMQANASERSVIGNIYENPELLKGST